MKSSNYVGERMARIETDIAYIKNMVNDTHKIVQKHIECTQQQFKVEREANDNRYASKIVERFVYGMIVTICLAVLSGILVLVLR